MKVEKGCILSQIYQSLIRTCQENRVSERILEKFGGKANSQSLTFNVLFIHYMFSSRVCLVMY